MCRQCSLPIIDQAQNQFSACASVQVVAMIRPNKKLSGVVCVDIVRGFSVSSTFLLSFKLNERGEV